MPTHDDEHTGARIREQRKRAGLTQRQLADRIPYSYSLLNQVECGARPATPAFVDAVACVLRIDATVLTGPADVSEVQRDRIAALVRPIREALAWYDLDAPMTDPARPVADLAVAADQVCQDVRATHLRKAARNLPPLITALTAAAQANPTTATWQALASTYRTAHDVALKLGHRDLATIALDRMGWAAERASDPCLGAIRHYKRALGHKRADHLLGQRLIEAGQRLLEGDTSREALAVAGQLHLGAAAVAARAEDAAAVATHIAQARELAGRVGGEAPEVHWLSFGYVNAALHEMTASLHQRRFDEALSQARRIRLPASTLTSRRARYMVDRAVAEMETGHPDHALRYLLEARRVAPEQTRYHPGARDAITGLLHTARRPPDTLNHLAAWIGL
ncbi:helix-turn-helix domain-containing protein [Streptomyces sp. SP18CS02]|uniref:helix-turn-helix domain-containing protein n=1 Tax=Streptomyces sp. SP18CS02 TaxID=3002531 RepID=UPI002E79B6EF|nr:helix-turn-helix transcriptional regulator [Streptomyces sp. SP18CS02]MEE1753750.1 helix-turn-helix transcriptional regulator [Streptomyces sp. SP18CS02]